MIRPSPFSVRGRRALALVRDERDLSVLRGQLERLGMIFEFGEIDEARSSSNPADVVILDADIVPVGFDFSKVAKADTPVIALVGTETPSRLKSLLDLEPACFLIKPLRSAGLYAAIVFGFDRAQKTADASRRIVRLEERVRARRVVLSATLLVMRRFDLSEPDAFALIRRSAMQKRFTIEQLSADIVATGNIPLLTPRIA
jgi:AmiR/NasT family two-component response regulator